MKNLNTNAIYEIGTSISNNLEDYNNKLKDAKLILCVDEEYFKKIDEDIFYKINSNLDDKDKKEFIPSENEIILTFPNNKIIIKKCAAN